MLLVYITIIPICYITLEYVISKNYNKYESFTVENMINYGIVLLKDGYHKIHYKLLRRNKIFFNDVYEENVSGEFILPFIDVLDFKLSCKEVEVELNSENIRELRSFGVYLSKGVNEVTICFEDIKGFCMLDNKIDEIKCIYLPLSCIEDLIINKDNKLKIKC